MRYALKCVEWAWRAIPSCLHPCRMRAFHGSRVMGVAGAAVFVLAALPAPAATVWNGPLLTFTEVSGADPTLPANQDRLTTNVWITRGAIQGIYNAALENGYNKADYSSPADTEWAYGALTNYASLHYTTWAAMSGKHPPSMVGKPAVVHLITDDIYLAVTFTSWGGSSGGFSYQRSTPAAVVKLVATASGGDITLSWTGGGTLQSADQVTGPWTNLAGATSPYQTAATAPARFYRVTF